MLVSKNYERGKAEPQKAEPQNKTISLFLSTP
jgi:hypothetical protein